MFLHATSLITIISLLISGGFWIRPVQADAATVIINELLWMGSSTSSADEWIELRNVTDQAVDLSNWKFTKRSSGAETAMLTLPAGSVITAGGYWLVSNYPETSTSSALQTSPNLVDTDMALANTALQIKLYDASGTLMDTADDGSGNPLAGRYVSTDQIYWSMERNPAPGDGTLPESWHTASRGAGFKSSQPEYGTPGAANTNGRPIATAGPALAGVVGQPVNFDGSDSTDPEQQPLTYAWDFGDSGTGSGSTPNHVYATAGEFKVTLSVSDGIDTATDSLAVTISAAAAPATPSPPTFPNPSDPAEGSAKTSCRGITISELWPNPAGVDDAEFIELVNPSKQSISLAGCSVWLNEKRRYTFTDGAVAAGQYFVLEKSVSKLSLTNTGGTVRLENSDGITLETVEYPPAPENESWANLHGQWTWTNQVTKGTKNLEPVDDDAAEAKTTLSVTAKTAQSVGLADIQTLESGELVKVQGAVTVAADVLASRTIWFQDDTAGLEALLAEDALRPAVGDMVEMVGTVRSYQGRKRISVKAGDMKILASGRLVEPKKITNDQLTVDMADQLVSLEGVISSASGSKILVDDGSGEIEVYLKSSTGIVKPKMNGGDRLAVVGIVNVATAGIKILPRTLDDLKVERVLGAATQAAPKPTQLPTAPPHQTSWYWVLVGAGILVASAKPAWEAWKKKKS